MHSIFFFVDVDGEEDDDASMGRDVLGSPLLASSSLRNAQTPLC